MVYDAVIIGGGIVGCSIFNKLTRLGLKVALVEKGDDVALGTSRANSAIIHAGFDCHPGTLKAKLNVMGNPIMYKLAKELKVPYSNCGALVIGNNMDAVKDLFNRGIKNGVSGLEIWNREQIIKKVPNIADEVTCGLYAKTSGIISPFMYTIALAEQAVINGAKIFFNTLINKVTFNNNIYTLYAPNFELKSKIIINAAAFGFNDVAKLIGSETYPIRCRRGEYYMLDETTPNMPTLSVFPLPSKFSKGILITPTTYGEYLVGPTSYESDETTITTPSGLKEITESTSHIFKNIPFKLNVRNFSGVRCLVGDDFVIEMSKKKPNVVNIVGICSPGLTSAPAIAEYVVELLKLNNKEKKLKASLPYTKVSKMSEEKLNELIKSNPDYGKIICKCEKVTLGEIKEALNSPLKPKSVDAIKRRVYAGMGRCQGGFCLTKVIKIIAEHNKISELEVNKENIGSNFYVDNIL